VSKKFQKKVSVFALSAFKGWILEGQFKDAATVSKVRLIVRYIPSQKIHLLRILDTLGFLLSLRTNRPYLFVNQTTFYFANRIKLMGFNPGLCTVFYSHYTDNGLSRNQQAKLLSMCKKILVHSKQEAKKLIMDGVPKSKISVIYGGIDRHIFYPCSRPKTKEELAKEGYVIVVGDCKARKNPVLTIKVIQKMQNQKFIIHGRGWRKFLNENFIETPNNLELQEFSFKNQPALVRHASVFLSLSLMEGGPYPTLEALASGTPVVVTETGWNKEIVTKEFGIVLPINATTESVIYAIQKMKNLKIKASDKDLLKGKFTWEEFADKVFFTI
jgi:glycosyltransferase involved in cell wall biosynthesis